MKPDDRRQSCKCGHRHSDHGLNHPGGKCLAQIDDPQKSSLYLCPCIEWEPWVLHDYRVERKPE